MKNLFKTFRKHFGKDDAQRIINGLNTINYKEDGGGEQNDEVKVKWCDVSVQTTSPLQVVVSYYDDKYPIGILKIQATGYIYYFHTTFSVNNTNGKTMYTADITDSSFNTVYEENKNLQALCIMYY